MEIFEKTEDKASLAFSTKKMLLKNVSAGNLVEWTNWKGESEKGVKIFTFMVGKRGSISSIESNGELLGLGKRPPKPRVKRKHPSVCKRNIWRDRARKYGVKMKIDMSKNKAMNYWIAPFKEQFIKRTFRGDVDRIKKVAFFQGKREEIWKGSDMVLKYGCDAFKVARLTDVFEKWKEMPLSTEKE